jgi:hypothetical protein
VHILAVEILNCILGITVIVEVDEPEPVLDGNLSQFAVALEELLDVPVPAVVGNVADENTLLENKKNILSYLKGYLGQPNQPLYFKASLPLTLTNFARALKLWP